ncbi:tetraacyldisaccharide 4'-kinase [Aeromonas simiae]|uniref:tetraacyldisaccharide 4'-kinase n=1 Tax=Aeromonas simiae TaxID=218936 RepID=UPI00266C1BC4|nr:tetraacyldisaccharide 4'-kinase [Aeromonas simiae]MDO2948482.1 tetraacyldisaccharide 4'-kinase [Aeromonas simiae]MDO2951512.1 tetraacyldisaccharide 4'-kinase [Aeromonas simiae]MDO2955865.1 tetraacyldisaccharide 4'-kinase [Aeromonas simiae]
MMASLWYDKSPLRWGLLPLAGLFAAVSGARRAAYRLGWCQAYRSTLPVIVVGNLSVGGNGKTPVVIWLVESLRAHGFRPGVVSRGYGGKAAGYPLRLTGDTGTIEAGDEPVLIHRRCGCPVAVSPKRAEAVRLLEQSGEVDIIVTDDGLQHYGLSRDAEIVVVDGVRRFGNGCLLPMGPLREPLSRLASVDAIICNGGEPQPGEWAMRLVPDAPRRVLDDAPLTGPLGPRVDALAGIGHPPRFFTTLRELGYDLVQAQGYPDHHGFDEAELVARFNERPLLMTEKDAVKCRAFARPNWWYIPVRADLPEGLLGTLMTSLKE